ncbi:MAG: hypothetical protein R3213_13410 [Flavobacteriaceae bacterium]|nr:hypothetical protein [Flavobacteriaceae bacterium]
MHKIKVSIEELEAALGELKARSKGDFVDVDIDGRNLKLSAVDRSDNVMEAILNNDNKMSAQFRYTERLMYMKEKKRL